MSGLRYRGVVKVEWSMLSRSLETVGLVTWTKTYIYSDRCWTALEGIYSNGGNIGSVCNSKTDR